MYGGVEPASCPHRAPLAFRHYCRHLAYLPSLLGLSRVNSVVGKAARIEDGADNNETALDASFDTRRLAAMGWEWHGMIH